MQQYKDVQEQQKHHKSKSSCRKRKKGKLPQEPTMMPRASIVAAHKSDTNQKAKRTVSLHFSLMKDSEISVNWLLQNCICASTQDHLLLLRNATALFLGAPLTVTPHRQLQVAKGMWYTLCSCFRNVIFFLLPLLCCVFVVYGCSCVIF